MSLFSKKPNPAVQRLPSGSMTVDRNGNVVATTVSSTYPNSLLREIAAEVLGIFREARSAQMPLPEFNIQFASLQINAREMGGGAIIFLSPNIPFTTTSAT
jgi:hypothetical protein